MIINKIRHIFASLPYLPIWTKLAIIICVDLLLLCTAFYLSMMLRFDNTYIDIYIISSPFFWLFSLLYSLLAIIILYALGHYRQVIRYYSLDTFAKTALGIIVASAFWISTYNVMQYYDIYFIIPRTVWVLTPILSIVFIIGIRLAVSYIFLNAKQRKIRHTILIAGDDIDDMRALANFLQNSAKIIGFITNDKHHITRMVNGYTVYYADDDISHIIKSYNVQEIILADSASINTRKKIIEIVDMAAISVRSMPDITNIHNQHYDILAIPKIDIQDLLGRPLRYLDNNMMTQAINDKTILVTGAAGSIGKELTSIISQYNYAHLIVFDQSEYGLYELEKYLHDIPNITYILGSVSDKNFIDHIFNQYTIDVVYHAAAYKHVPIVEDNPISAAITNVIGTYNIAESCYKYNVKQCILVSTDKAVNPPNFMGASKRIAELIMVYFGRLAEANHNNLNTLMVRFGNVLESSGSVVPLFRKQIQHHQALTVTDKEITRYFMAIEEAASLICQASSLEHGNGTIYLLDMGKPVKIYDLACTMIRLYGKHVQSDAHPNGIPIKIIGLRPGEKLYEELLIDADNIQRTSHQQIYYSHDPSFNNDDIREIYDIICSYIATNDSESLINYVKYIANKHE